MPVPRAAALPLLSLLAAVPPTRAAESAPELPAAAPAVRALPCAGDAEADGFVPVDGLPSPWRVAGALVSVRRGDAGDRVAFVLDPPRPGAADCAVREAIPLPRRGEVLGCALQDGSVSGLGVHALSKTDGRRDLVFWRGDGAGGLRRPKPGERDYESDTGELICTPPDPIP